MTGGESTDPPIINVTLPDDPSRLEAYFADIGYGIDLDHALPATVPRIQLTRLPSNLATIATVDQRKTLFLQIVPPLVLEINRVYRAEHRRLKSLRAIIRSNDLLRFDNISLVDNTPVWMVELTLPANTDTQVALVENEVND